MYISKEDFSLADEVRVETGWIIQHEKIESYVISVNLQQIAIRELSETDPLKGLCEIIQVMRLHSGTGSQHCLILNLKQLKQILCPLTTQTSDLYFLLYGKGL